MWTKWVLFLTKHQRVLQSTNSHTITLDREILINDSYIVLQLHTDCFCKRLAKRYSIFKTKMTERKCDTRLGKKCKTYLRKVKTMSSYKSRLLLRLQNILTRSSIVYVVWKKYFKRCRRKHFRRWHAGFDTPATSSIVYTEMKKVNSWKDYYYQPKFRLDSFHSYLNSCALSQANQMH